VDDEVDSVRTVTQHLKRNELGVEAVRSGDDALRHFAENPTDGMVLDVKTPGMGGSRRCARSRPDNRSWR
jgi:DNA-binding response OmpR family regulator